MKNSATIRLGTRSSALAQWQANWVATQLTESGYVVELVPIRTQGDVRQGSIASLGATGLFTKELQVALLDDRIDVAVHSLKDLPTESPAGLCLASVPLREDVRDALITVDRSGWEALATGARVGTGSVRRRAQLLHHRSDLNLLDIRGNVDTRLKKLRDGEFDAIILAVAGLQRLGWQEEIGEMFAADFLVPAVGQGALGIETRAADAFAREAVLPLCDPATYWSVAAERALLATLRGGCLAPVGAWGRPAGDSLELDAVVLSHDGRERLHASGSGKFDGPVTPAAIDATHETAAAGLGMQLAHDLLGQGADSLISAIRTEKS